MTEPFWETRRILVVRGGSHAYGLATPTSDLDLRAVCVPPRSVLLGIERFEQHTHPERDEITWSLARFAALALSGDLSLVELLFTAPEDVLLETPWGARLRAAGGLFLTRRLVERTLSWAEGQLRTLERHRERHAQGPRPERNPARAELEARFGYDTKAAALICRRLLVADELAREGALRVRRPDAPWLRGVRAGELSHADFLAWVAERQARAQAGLERCALPAKPDRAAVNALVVELQEDYLAQA
ncbi:MAG: nucleotidyltransferase domain-containing protein [Planctomycetota bacterium]